ncbi:MAG: tetratricopeptide repeat protein [Pyrinomonadaceae bacterium]
MLKRRAARPLFTLLAAPLLLLCVPHESAPAAQSNVKSPGPIQPNVRNNQQSTSEEALAEAARLIREAEELNRQGQVDAARGLLERALAIRERELTADDALMFVPLINLAMLYEMKGDHARSLPLIERALSNVEKNLGPEHLRVAGVLDDLADVYRRQGEYARVEQLLQRALAIREKALGVDHPDVAASANKLAVAYQSNGKYVKAGLLFQRALAIREKALGVDHPDVADVLTNLAAAYQADGDYTRAEPLYKQALTTYEKAFGFDHPQIVGALNNLATLYQEKSDYAQAEPLYLRALKIEEKTVGDKHFIATMLNNLASLYQARNDYARAKSTYQRALDIYENALGAGHPDVAITLNNLGGLYQSEGDYRQAELLDERALNIMENVLGAGHPEVGTALNNLAELYVEMGAYERAEPLLQRSLAIREKALGARHPDVAGVLYNLTGLYVLKGDAERAVSFMARASEIREYNLDLILGSGSENQKQLYIKSLAGETDSSISLHLQQAPNNPAALRLALTNILRRKGRALDAMTDQIGALRRRLDPQDRALLDQLSDARAQLSASVLRGAGPNDPAQHRAAVARLETEAARLESQVSARSAEFRVESQPVTIERVQGAVPADAALIELITYLPLNPKGREGKLWGREGELWGKRRYAAYVLRREGAAAFVDLGEVVPINRLVGQLRVALFDPESTNAGQLGRALDELVMRPVRKLTGTARQLLISPDGAFNLVPFDALVDEHDRYLIESYSISYLTSGRDLLRLETQAQPREGMVVFANPLFDFNVGGNQTKNSTPANRVGAPVVVTGTSATPATSLGRRSIDVTTGTFPPLNGTAKEAQAIAALFPGVKPLIGAAATESALKHVSAPRILHIATHGRFLQDQPEQSPVKNGPGIGVGINSGLTGVAGAVGGENPLLRSFLVLAGANRLDGGAGEDGMLTALEAAGLDLWGTKLVVLSACQTGVGEVKNGEGVYGLRRALVLAGAESELMSLWPVSDEATGELMSEYYKRLKAGEGRTEALRQVQLKMLRSKDRTHPYFWASFIPVGDWRSLDGK